MVKAGCYIVLALSTSGMGVHGTVSTAVCAAPVSAARVQLPTRRLSCRRQFTRAGNEGCHLSHLYGVHRGTFCTVLARLASHDDAQMFGDVT